MKTLLLLLITLMLHTAASAQNTALSAEIQGAKHFDSTSPDHFQWASVTHTGKKAVGGFAFVSHERGIVSIALGPLLTIKPGNWYIETALGPGIDITRDVNTLSANGYVYLESKTDQDGQKGKVMMYSNPYYSDAYGFFQLTSLMYGVSDIFSVGLYTQTAAVTGVRTQFTIGSFNVSSTIGRESIMLGIGMDLKL